VCNTVHSTSIQQYEYRAVRNTVHITWAGALLVRCTGCTAAKAVHSATHDCLYTPFTLVLTHRHIRSRMAATATGSCRHQHGISHTHITMCITTSI
jgi:hypothetical protein